jgi:hypothetical protein
LQISVATLNYENTPPSQIARYRLPGIAAALGELSRAHMEPDLAAMVLEAPGLFLSDLKRSRPLRLRGPAIVKYGYARVSTDDQTPALQLAALKKAGCKTVFKDDGISGATTKRPALLRCLKKLEPGDTLIVWKLDRLGRSLRDLIRMLDELKQRGVKFRSLTEHIDTDTPTGCAMWQMIGL